ncbi:50S ribosomal protein L25 [Candidatus Roizmanbacteria bacterium]|nr:50S ribosomal protein L25 [Candidatus Roizmanbacteria bacterium]
MPRQKKSKEEPVTLSVQKRDIVGKKVKQLRKNALIPANIFGTGFTSISISTPFKDFIQAYKIAHETGIIYLNLDSQSIPTLIRSVQYHPVTNQILHVDFRKIDLKQKIETEVPIEIVGESVAVTQLGGVLLKQHEHLTVEALPQNIPQHITIDVARIQELGQDIKIADLPKSPDYEIKQDPETIIVSIIAHKEESITPETAVAAPEVIEKPEEEQEGETPTAPAEQAKEVKEE